MQKPEMILFDYGDTLVHICSSDHLRGHRAIFPYIAGNPRHVTPEQVTERCDALWQQWRPCRDVDAEIYEPHLLRAVYGSFGLAFSRPLAELEALYWDAAAPEEPMPYARDMLAALGRMGMRTGVISNIGYSGKALESRMGALLPENRFEFVVASSEFILRKPHPLLFQIALEKARLPASAVWYCGNDLRKDVGGAHGAGLFPVWYTGSMEGPLPSTEIPHLAVRDWRELPAFLGACGG